MYEVTVKDRFSAAHQLWDTQGKLENLHGHNWKVESVVASEKLDDMGVVVDFHLVEAFSRKIIEKFDHQVLNELPLFQDLNPSAENIARVIFEELKEKLSSSPVQMSKVTVWETSTCGASYSC